MEFGKLVDRVVTDVEVRSEIDMLLDAKRAGAELDKGPENRVISGFLEQQLSRLEASVSDRQTALLSKAVRD